MAFGCSEMRELKVKDCKTKWLHQKTKPSPMKKSIKVDSDTVFTSEIKLKTGIE